LGQGEENMIQYSDKIQERIDGSNSDKIFIANDFFDIASYETVRKTLNRMVRDSKIKKILKGLYYQPIYNDLIEEYEAPSMHQVALALARKYNWTIAPSGNTALNMLGLSTQVTAQWTYISNGRYVKYTLEKNLLEFKHVKNSEISNMAIETAMVIQAIKAIGRERITEEQMSIIRRKLTSIQKKKLLEESKYSTQWIYQVIRAICEEADE